MRTARAARRRTGVASACAIAAVMALSGCETIQVEPVTKDEFTASNVHVHAFPGKPDQTCEAAKRALLSHGYVIEEASAGSVRGRKNFQPHNDIHSQIAFYVVCAPNSRGSNTSTVFANAVKDRYALRKTSNNASVGLGALGSFTLPIGSSSDAMVKVASETVTSKEFYRRFFEIVDGYLDLPWDMTDEAPVTAEPARMPEPAVTGPAPRSVHLPSAATELAADAETVLPAPGAPAARAPSETGQTLASPGPGADSTSVAPAPAKAEAEAEAEAIQFDAPSVPGATAPAK